MSTKPPVPLKTPPAHLNQVARSFGNHVMTHHLAPAGTACAIISVPTCALRSRCEGAAEFRLSGAMVRVQFGAVAQLLAFVYRTAGRRTEAHA